MSVYKRGKAWYVNLWAGTPHRVNRVAGATKKEAQDGEAELKRRRRLRSFGINEPDYTDYEFKVLAEEYFTHIKAIYTNPAYVVEKNYFDNHARDFFESETVSSLTNGHLFDFQADRKKTGLSGRAVNILLSIVRRILKHASFKHKSVKTILVETDLQFPKKCAELKKNSPSSLMKNSKRLPLW